MRVMLFLWSVAAVSAVATPRARGLDVPFENTPGPLNAITDVAGVGRVRHAKWFQHSGRPRANPPSEVSLYESRMSAPVRRMVSMT